ncbi:MAG: DUF3298 and DUF4163 domain-containing protein [Firmicutes bacterium]|nr:DUF3298 and DUF4163 domain-containing protein [Bacillota bacterium]
MKKVQMVSALFIVVFLTAGVVQPALASTYWERMAQGFPNSITVYDYVYQLQSAELEVNARIPQLHGMPDLNWQADFNASLREGLIQFVAHLQDMVWEDQMYPYEGLIDFEVKLNRGGLLSIAIVSYTFTGGAHGMTAYVYRNLDLSTGQEIAFYDLFNTDAEIERAAQVINEKIVQEPDWFFIDHFTPSLFSENQGYYLQENQAVICFGLYELAPYAAGIQEFAVSAP